MPSSHDHVSECDTAGAPYHNLCSSRKVSGLTPTAVFALAPPKSPIESVGSHFTTAMQERWPQPQPGPAAAATSPASCLRWAAAAGGQPQRMLHRSRSGWRRRLASPAAAPAAAHLCAAGQDSSQFPCKAAAAGGDIPWQPLLRSENVMILQTRK
jgi:hypothetical protein